MGLDQYAYVAAKNKAMQEYWEQDTDGKLERPRELAYWRKHPNLQGWMEQLWLQKLAKQGKTPGDTEWGSSFNGVELELTREDIDQLEQDVLAGRLPSTEGFFFGKPSDEYYKEHDLEFVKQARAELFCGLRVFYNSSW